MVKYSEWDSTTRTAPQQGLRLKWSPTCNNARYNYAVATVRLLVSVVYLSAQSRMPNSRTLACFHTNLQSAPRGRGTTPQQQEPSVPSYSFSLVLLLLRNIRIVRQWRVFGYNGSFSPEATYHNAGKPAED